MISAETIAELQARGLFYILGVRERTDKLVRDLVLDDPALVPLTISKRRKSVDYEARAVTLAERRYIVCRNHDEAKKDAVDRAAILAALERQLKKATRPSLAIPAIFTSWHQPARIASRPRSSTTTGASC